MKSFKPFNKIKSRPCVFEYIYFARPDSILNGECAYEYRKRLGQQLVRESNINANIVVPVPDSGVPAAIGFHNHQKLNLNLGLSEIIM